VIYADTHAHNKITDLFSSSDWGKQSEYSQEEKVLEGVQRGDYPEL
jgi:hypothetical protein